MSNSTGAMFADVVAAGGIDHSAEVTSSAAVVPVDAGDSPSDAAAASLSPTPPEPASASHSPSMHISPLLQRQTMAATAANGAPEAMAGGGRSRAESFRHSFIAIDHPLMPTAQPPQHTQPPQTQPPHTVPGSTAAAGPSAASRPGSSASRPPPTDITMGRLVKMLSFFIFQYSKSPSVHRNSPHSLVIQQRVTQLCARDYHVSVIHNDSRNGAATNLAHQQQAASGGVGAMPAAPASDASFEYCSSYPLELIIFENERTGPYGIDNAKGGSEAHDMGGAASPTLQSRVNDSAVLKPLFRLSRFSRVHGRFVIPVILVHNKNICRSSTLALQAEAIFNNIHAKTKDVFSSMWGALSGGLGAAITGAGATASGGVPAPLTSPTSTTSSSASAPAHTVQVGLEGQRGHDIQLLLHTATSYIEDLMVEHKKRKMGVALTSSEKNEEWRYGQMKLNALPYPGCEFFAEYKSNGHSGLQLLFNWNQSFISSDLLLSNPPPMIPDELLSTNGRLPLVTGPVAMRSTRAQVAELMSPWYEFEHCADDHQAEVEARIRAQLQLDLAPLQLDLPVSNGTQSPPLSASPTLSPKAAGANAVTSPPPFPTSVSSSSSSSSSSLSEQPSPLGVVAAEIKDGVDAAVDHLMSHSASAGSTEPMATSTTASNMESASVGVMSSSSSGTPSPTVSSTSPPAAAASTASIAAAAAPVPAVAAPAASSDVTSFSLYRSWDVITLTKNYLLILLAHVADESPNSGVLVHCISGWDRTPLFVSLLRISLWADGEVHRSLNAMQLLYLTLGYDWMLFGHHLFDRLQKGEDVMYFCFDFLQYITNTKFSLAHAISMRHQKRVVQSELEIERSATPTPQSCAAAAGPASSADMPRRKSALTAALESQAASGMPPMRKSVSDGSGSVDASASSKQPSHAAGGSARALSPAAASDDLDESRDAIVVSAGSAPFSPPGGSGLGLHTVPGPASASYTAAKPTPSLSSFIIDGSEHGSAQQVHSGHTPLKDMTASKSAAHALPVSTPGSSSEVSASPADETTEDEEDGLPRSPYRPSAAAVPIPQPRRTSSGSAHGGSASGSSAHPTSAVAAPAAVSSSVAADSTPAGSAIAGPNGAHMSRVNSWTILSTEKQTPPTASLMAAHAGEEQRQASILHAASTRPSDSLRTPAGAATSTSANGTRSSAGSTQHASSGFRSHKHAPPSAEARAASARRCDRLLEVRQLFMQAYHHVLPATAPAPTPPHARSTSYAHEAASALASRRVSTSSAHPLGEAAESASDAYRIAAGISPPAPAAKAAPVAMPVTAHASATASANGAPTAGWFSS